MSSGPYFHEEYGEHDPLALLLDDPETDSVHHPYTAYNQGWDAERAGINRMLNPYERGTREAEWWDNGWRESKGGGG